MNKKDIPYQLLEAVQNTIGKMDELVIPVDDTQAYIHLKDLDESSKFYFRVLPNKNSLYPYDIHHFPKSKKEFNDDKREMIGIKSVVKYLERWLELIREYNFSNTIFDDGIVIGYQEDFFKDFEAVTFEIPQRAFSYEQQIQLIGYIDELIPLLMAFRDNPSYPGIVSQGKRLQETISERMKTDWLKSFALLLAKIFKMGSIPLLQKVYLVRKNELLNTILPTKD